MAALILIFFILACVVNSIYFLWVSILWSFPKVLHVQKDGVTDDTVFDDCRMFLIVPCLNEEAVCGATVRNLLSFNINGLTIVAVDDDSDDGTLEILRGIESPALHVLARKKPDAQQGKGRTLNFAYRYILDLTRSEGLDAQRVIIGVFDADTYIQKSLLQRAAGIMLAEPKCAMLQCRVRIGVSTRDHLLPLMQDIEFFSCNNLMQNVREYTGTVGAAGNGQFSRLSAMEEMGDEPWSDCLLEDFDFSLRLLLMGWRTRLLQDERVYQQGVTSYSKFVNQRARWAQGGLQCWKYFGRVIHSGYLSFSGKLELSYFMMIPIVGLVSCAVLAFCWFLTLFYSSPEGITAIIYGLSTLEDTVLALLVLACVYTPGMVFCLKYRKDTGTGLLNALLAAFFMPIYNLMQVPPALLAIYRQITMRTGWEKTEHTSE